jgi:lysophospholipase L1-like esterase
MREFLVSSLVLCACSRGAPAPAGGADAQPQVAALAPAGLDAAQGEEPDGAASRDAAPAPKMYARVLHTGDSMVGGGLCKALQPRFEAEGGKFYRDVWESGRVFQFAQSDRIPKLLKKIDPDLVVITLGANDVWLNEPDQIREGAEKIARMVTEGGRACWWIGPPIWKAYFKGIVELLRDHVAPCIFFDSSGIEMPRRSDGIHPTDKGGEVWADAFWKAFRE